MFAITSINNPASPLVVVDDDISGTYTFVQALEEHVTTGGNGIMTKHTAYLDLKNSIAAPRRGSIDMNGKQITEHIGAQIFIY